MSHLTRRTLIASAASVTACGLCMPHIAHASVRTVRLGHNNTDQSQGGQGAAAFAAAVAAEPLLGGAIRIEVHGDSELGDELSMLKGCVAGTVDMMICSSAAVGNVVPQAGIVNTPFLFRDNAHARAALDGAIGAELAALARPSGVTILGWGDNGMRHITANQPIRTPPDVRGLKIRVPQSEVMLGGFRALGAAPAPLSFLLMREALRTGQFDAQENAIVVIEGLRLHEVQKYVSLTSHTYDAAIFIASPDLMEDLTETQHAALADCARAGARVTRQVVDAADRDGIGRLKTAGMTIVDDVDLAAFRAAAQPYLDSLAAKFGADFVNRVRGAAT